MQRSRGKGTALPLGLEESGTRLSRAKGGQGPRQGGTSPLGTGTEQHSGNTDRKAFGKTDQPPRGGGGTAPEGAEIAEGKAESLTRRQRFHRTVGGAASSLAATWPPFLITPLPSP